MNDQALAFLELLRPLKRFSRGAKICLSFQTAQIWPLSMTEDYTPAIMPTISGNTNSRMESTPRM